jgi:hypothetical protein
VVPPPPAPDRTVMRLSNHVRVQGSMSLAAARKRQVARRRV